jgi:hypothetical protein
MPTWTAPRLPPPLSTNAVLIRAIALRIDRPQPRAELCLRCPLDVRGGPPVPATQGLHLIAICEREERGATCAPRRSGLPAMAFYRRCLSYIHLFRMFPVVPRKHFGSSPPTHKPTHDLRGLQRTPVDGSGQWKRVTMRVDVVGFCGATDLGFPCDPKRSLVAGLLRARHDEARHQAGLHRSVVVGAARTKATTLILQSSGIPAKDSMRR